VALLAPHGRMALARLGAVRPVRLVQLGLEGLEARLAAEPRVSVGLLLDAVRHGPAHGHGARLLARCRVARVLGKGVLAPPVLVLGVHPFLLALEFSFQSIQDPIDRKNNLYARRISMDLCQIVCKRLQHQLKDEIGIRNLQRHTCKLRLASMKVQSIVAPLSVCSLEAQQGLQVVEVSRQARHGELQGVRVPFLVRVRVRALQELHSALQEPLALQELLQVQREA